MTSHDCVASHGGPEVAKRLLARELRALRVQAGLPLPAVTRALKCSPAKVRHLETFRNLPSYPDLKALLELYGAMDQLDHLDELRESAREAGWWDEYRLFPTTQEYIGLEDAATTAQRFTPAIIPGMLQTEAYAREIGRASDLSQDEKDRNVAARLRRGKRLHRGDITLSAVMSETLLYRTANTGDAGVEQLNQLHNATAMPNVTLQVLPFTVGTQWEMGSSFTILTFPPGLLGPIVHQDHTDIDTFTEDPVIVKKLQDRYTILQTQALSSEESLALIGKFISREVAS